MMLARPTLIPPLKLYHHVKVLLITRAEDVPHIQYPRLLQSREPGVAMIFPFVSLLSLSLFLFSNTVGAPANQR